MVTHDLSYKFMFSNLPIGVIVVDRDTRLVDANQYIFRYFNVEKVEVKGQGFGNAFNCSKIKGTDYICGEAPQCESCEFIKGLKRVTQQGQEYITDVEYKHLFNQNGRDAVKWFILSGAKVIEKEEELIFITFSDITDIKKAEEELINLGITDELTGLYNRRYIFKMLDELLKNEKNENSNLAVAMVDIDYFKKVNDVYGHLTGDEVLKALADICKKNTRKYDHFGRYGGEEFLLIFSNVDIETAEKVLQRIAKKFRDVMAPKINYPLTFSAGLVPVDLSEETKEAREYIDLADKLLYKAKELGRDRIEI
jgi:diguanylate cyclase (GGDEF)-like protein